jgi:hypothetical protein
MTAFVVWWSGFKDTDPEVRVRFPVLQDFLRTSGLERDPLSLVSITEELLERKSRGSGLGNCNYGRSGSSRLSDINFADKQRSLGR